MSSQASPIKHHGADPVRSTNGLECAAPAAHSAAPRSRTINILISRLLNSRENSLVKVNPMVTGPLVQPRHCQANNHALFQALSATKAQSMRTGAHTSLSILRLTFSVTPNPRPSLVGES